MKKLLSSIILMLIFIISGCDAIEKATPHDPNGYRTTGIPFRVYILKDGTRCAYNNAIYAMAIDCDWTPKK